MQKIILPLPFQIKNNDRKITVVPVYAEWRHDNDELMVNCELYWNNAKVPAFKETCTIEMLIEPEVKRNEMASFRYVQKELDAYFASIYPTVVAKYLTK